MNGILTLTRNNLALTQRCLHSASRQSQRATIRAIDNGSSDISATWLRAYGWLLDASSENLGVSKGWNQGLAWFFHYGFEAVLVIGNDTWLPEYFLEELLSYDLPFITGVAVDNMAQIQAKPNKEPLSRHPDFSAFLVRKSCWEQVGPFDERMKLYAQDTDWHVRAHRMGIALWKASCEFYHERSSTLRNAPPEEAAQIQEQANKDRAMFQSLYGCQPGTREYEMIFEQSPEPQTVPAQE